MSINKTIKVIVEGHITPALVDSDFIYTLDEPKVKN